MRQLQRLSAASLERAIGDSAGPSTAAAAAAAAAWAGVNETPVLLRAPACVSTAPTSEAVAASSTPLLTGAHHRRLLGHAHQQQQQQQQQRWMASAAAALAASPAQRHQEQQQHGGARWWSYARTAAVAGATAAAALALASPLPAQAGSWSSTNAGASKEAEASGKQWSLLSLEDRRRIFFKYEKRIRDNSTLEKIFDYFSNEEKDGVKYLSPLDLLSAIVPTYPPSQSTQERSGSLDGEPQPHVPRNVQLEKASETIFKQFDVDGDGRLSFWEYRLVLTLLSIPERDAEVIFSVMDSDGNGTVDASEFQDLISMLQGTSTAAAGPINGPHAGVSKAPGNRLGRGSNHPSSQAPVPSGLLVFFFGPDQKGLLKVQTFLKFLAQLHSDIAELEFMHYDVPGKGTMPGVDFARALVAVADIRQVDALLNKVDALPAALRAAPITRQDFRGMVSLARKRHSLEVALHFCGQLGRPVTKQELDSVVRKVAGVKFSSAALDVILGVFAAPPAGGGTVVDAEAPLDALPVEEGGTGESLQARAARERAPVLDVQLFNQMMKRRGQLWIARAPVMESATSTGTESGLSRLWSKLKNDS